MPSKRYRILISLFFSFCKNQYQYPNTWFVLFFYNKLTFLSENVINSFVFLKGFAKNFFLFHYSLFSTVPYYCSNSYWCHFFTVYIWNIKFSTRFVLNFSLCYVQFVPYCTVLKYFSRRHRRVNTIEYSRRDSRILEEAILFANTY